MLAKLKIGTPGGGLPATKHTRKMPEDMDAPFKPAASCARIYHRVDAAEDVHKHFDGPHVPVANMPNAPRKGRIVTKG